ncbi:MAG: hypothetical protein PHX80_05400 [Candidatus Nanoarchaeia archaeon]|nr:hypothetical protein [Candidatus Nanoarchaeia archaeon]
MIDFTQKFNLIDAPIDPETAKRIAGDEAFIKSQIALAKKNLEPIKTIQPKQPIIQDEPDKKRNYIVIAVVALIVIVLLIYAFKK